MPNIFHLIVNPKSLEHYQEIKEYLTSLAYFQYMKVVEHIGQDEKHYHIALQLNNKLNRLSTKKTYGAHIKRNDPKLKGSFARLVDYIDCKDEKHIKEGVTAKLIEEIGERLTTGGNKWTIQRLATCNSQEEDIPPMYYNIRQKIKQERALRIPDDELDRKSIKVYYIQGASGIGKTELAKKIIKKYSDIDNCSNKVKFHDGFWHGVDGITKKCIYDDFRSSDMKAKEFVQFIDYNVNIMNVKGGSKWNHYELIVITSVEKLEDIYKKVKGEPREQWIRRITLIDLYNHNESYYINFNKRALENSFEHENSKKIRLDSDNCIYSIDNDDACIYCDLGKDCHCKCIETQKRCKNIYCNLR